MKSLDFGRYALGGFAAAAMLAGCGGSQAPIGAPAMLRGSATATRQAGGASKSTDAILYVNQENRVAMLTYPGLTLIGTFSYPDKDFQFEQPCPDDRTGNIYFPENLHVHGGGLEEYSDGGTKPIGYLKPPLGYNAVSCSIDPATGNLAVVLGVFPTSKPTEVGVYAAGSHHPMATYKYPHLRWYASCAYDNTGNLFVVGETTNYKTLFLELPKGGSELLSLKVNVSFSDAEAIQWDGSYIAVQSWGAEKKYPHRILTIYRMAVSGSETTVVGKTVPYGAARAAWIQGADTLITGRYCQNSSCSTHIGFYDYPAGRKAISIFKGLGQRAGQILGLAVATPTSGRRQGVR